jgi:aspartate/methionine/tyrosine aminotransferase
MFNERAEEATQAFEGCEYVIANKPGGAFYYTIMFKDGVLNGHQTLAIDNPQVKARIEELIQGVSPDKRFVYYLMGATGIVVVPLTGFQCNHEGFRFTLLESNPEKRQHIFQTLRNAIDEYCGQ